MSRFSMQTLVFLSLVAVLPSADARQGNKATVARPGLLRDLPSPLSFHALALGDRVLAAGKEKTVIDGQFVDENGKTSGVRLTLQLPGLVRVEGLVPGGPPLTFDGETRPRRNTRIEETLLETLTSDTAEGMLASIKEGSAVQLVARRVGPDPFGPQADTSVLQDIFEISGPVRSSATNLERLKRYFFDSETGLLASTKYLDETFSPPVAVETKFLNWRRVDGSPYPGRVEHLENGHTTFSLSVTTIAASPREDPANFR